jgi:mono/diheme cytochrome c family protein
MRFLIVAFLLLTTPALAADGDAATVQRGKYLADVGDCTSCHTTPEHGYFAGGLPLEAPFGTIFSTNITPDKQFGIGNYTREQFIRVMREGVAADGHHLYPAMPYASFATESDADLNALYDYLMQGIEQVPYKPPETKLVFPFSQRWGMALWDAVFARHERFVPDPARGAQWNRGAYLVQGLGHCGACHTPRGLAYEERGYDESSPSYLKGSVADKWATANLSGDLGAGLGRWSEADIASFLKTGHGGGGAAFGNMKEAVEKSTQYMTDEDRLAIAHYLKSFPETEAEIAFRPTAPDVANRMQAEGTNQHEMPGAGIYASSCSGCHGADGAGHLPRIPQLAGNPVVMTKDPTSLIRLVLEGSTSPQTEAGPDPMHMPAFANLTDREIAEVVNYVRTDWGNEAPQVSERDVTSLRAGLAKLQADKEKGKHKADAQP